MSGEAHQSVRQNTITRVRELMPNTGQEPDVRGEGVRLSTGKASEGR